jgi:hypothetical protein
MVKDGTVNSTIVVYYTEACAYIHQPTSKHEDIGSETLCRIRLHVIIFGIGYL